MVKSSLLLLVSICFLLLGVFSSDLFVRPISEKELALQVSKSLQSEIALAEQEAEMLLANTNPENALWSKLHYSFFLLDSSKVIAWSKNNFLPDVYALRNSSLLSLLRVSRGDFLIRKWILGTDRYLIFVLTLRERFSIENQYLQPVVNDRIFQSPVLIDDLINGKGSPVCIANDQCLFRVSVNTDAESSSNYVGMLFVLCAIISLTIFLVLLVNSYHKQRKWQTAFVLLVVSLGAIRIVMVKFNFPGVFVDFSLFDPKQFASSSFNASIADLFLNALVVLSLCIYLFLHYSHFSVVKAAVRDSNTYRRTVYAISFSFLCFLSFLFPFLFFETVYHNSSISLGITESLTFSMTRIVAIVSVALGCVSGVLISHASFRLVLSLTRNASSKAISSILGGAILFLLFFTISGRNYWITLLVTVAYLIIIYSANYFDKLTKLSFNSFLYFLLMSVALSIQGALSIRQFTTERRIQDQYKYGSNFLIDQDVLGEYLMNECADRIRKDPFIQSRLSNPFLSKASIRQRIKQLYINTYFDRYDVKIYLFNSVGAPYGNESTTDFASSILGFQKEAFKTSYNGIYFINNPTSEVTKQYVVVIPLDRSGVGTGYITLELNLKRIIPENVFPELLADNRFAQYLANKNFNYAFYGKGKLTSSFGEFNYERDFDRRFLGEPAVYKEGLVTGNYFHLAIEGGDGNVAVISTREYPDFFVLTNFSFLFILNLTIILLLLLLIGINSLVKDYRLTYSTRIQLYIYLAFFLPLLSVSLTTLSLISRSAKDQLNSEFLSKATSMGSKLTTPLGMSGKDSIGGSGGFENELIVASKLANLDASVYAVDGHLISSSQQIVFENQFMAPLLNREVWEQLILNKENSITTQESIGKLVYNSSYASIKSPESGVIMGIVSIPFFESVASLEKTLINVLSNILTVFVAIFILFSILSYFAVKWLVFPLNLITKTLQKTSFSGKNEYIAWKANDEMGMLANEYNRMVENLEHSRRDLARSQKESAWREIAKQVAHEIKNPLTPMKLTLQQMELHLRKDELTPERTTKSIHSLLEQLEILNDIASSFSTFARMPAPEVANVELNSLLKRVVDLYSSYKQSTVEWGPSLQPLMIRGDEQLLVRTFSNIILNALQSATENREIVVKVLLKEHNKQAVITILDNGRGIQQEMMDKIFLPSFTTKKSGSGLGLAVAKQGVEMCSGSIEVESEIDKGTKFTIRFDLVPE